MEIKIEKVMVEVRRDTHKIGFVGRLFEEYKEKSVRSLDVFARNCRIFDVTNDIDESYETDENMDGFDFLWKYLDSSVDLVVLDPPWGQANMVRKYGSDGNYLKMMGRVYGVIKERLKEGGKVILVGYNCSLISMEFGYERFIVLDQGGLLNTPYLTVQVRECKQGYINK